MTTYTQSVTSSTHQALSRWHLSNGSLHGVEETQLTFVGFKTHFHHLVLGSIGPLKRWQPACTYHFAQSQGWGGTPYDLIFSLGGDRMRGTFYSSLFISQGCQYLTKYSHLWLWATGLRLLHLQVLHNILIANIHIFSHCLPQLPHTFHPRAKVWVPQQIMLLHPMLETPSVSYCQEG